MIKEIQPSTQSGDAGTPLERLGRAARHHQRAVDRFDQAVVDHLGLNRTDGRCLDVLQERGALTAGELARACGLTSGAVTAVLDRLAAAGFVRRMSDPDDRRKVIAQITPEAEERALEIYWPLKVAGEAALAHFTDAQLEAVIEFLDVDRDLHERLVERMTDAGRQPSAS